MDLSSLFALLPQQDYLYVAIVVVLCNAITIIFPPPAPTSRWANPYRLASMLAGNIGWAKNQFRVGLTGKMVPREMSKAANEALSNAEIPVTKAKNLPLAKRSSETPKS